jgi:putative ABC transport system ATP-binding protein
MTTAAPVIEARALVKTYPGPPAVHALGPVDLRIQRGEYLAIVGPSGSGKSTLLNLLGLLDEPTSGEYLFDGQPTAGLRDDERTALRGRRVGFVFQDFQLLPHRTAAGNVALGLLYLGLPRRLRMAEAAAALDRVGLGHRAAALPGQLSGGESQRVAIARALVTRPDVLLCDEPTGNLDSATADRILDLVDTLHDQGATIVVITHDPRTAARADRQVAVRDGRFDIAASRA